MYMLKPVRIKINSHAIIARPRDWDICLPLCSSSYSLLIFSIILASHGRERRHFRLNERIPVPNRLRLCPFHSVAGSSQSRDPVPSRIPNKYQEQPILILSFLLFCFRLSFVVTHFLQQCSVPRGNLYPRVTYKIKYLKVHLNQIFEYPTSRSCDFNWLIFSEITFYTAPPLGLWLLIIIHTWLTLYLHIDPFWQQSEIST